MPQNFTSPVGRIVQGDPWELKAQTEQNGTPKLYKSGPDAGKPMKQAFVAVAFSKTDPATNAFVQLLKNESASAWPSLFPQGPMGPCALPTFSMKVIDGDDATPMIDPATGRTSRHCDKEGFPGHMVVKFSSGYLPKVYENVPQGSQTYLEVTDKSRLKRGYYVRVAGTTQSNDNPQKPGIYVNLGAIEIVGQGPEITSGIDAATAFGGAGPAALPPGATPLTPGAVTGFTPPAAPPAPVAAPPAPHTTYMQAPPPAPPAPVGPVMTPLAAASGYTYEALKGAGWSDDQMRTAGYLA